MPGQSRPLLHRATLAALMLCAPRVYASSDNFSELGETVRELKQKGREIDAETRRRSEAERGRRLAANCQEHLSTDASGAKKLVESLIHADELNTALDEARGLDPGLAGDRVAILQERKRVPAHLGITLLLALRSQGYEPLEAVYCHRPDADGKPKEKWIGAATSSGLDFILDVSRAAKTGTGFSIEARRGAEPVGRSEGGSLDELVGCGSASAHINGASGALLETLRGKEYRRWRHTVDCEHLLRRTRKLAYGSFQQEPTSDPGLAESMARRAKAHGGHGTGWCYEHVLYAIEESGIVRTRKKDEPWLDYYNRINLGVARAGQFAEYANSSPAALRRHFGLTKLPTPKDPTRIPRGGIVVYEPGVCGFHWRAGHIEIAQGDGTACSDHCQELYSTCFANFTQDIHVYVPAK